MWLCEVWGHETKLKQGSKGEAVCCVIYGNEGEEAELCEAVCCVREWLSEGEDVTTQGKALATFALYLKMTSHN